LPWIPREGVDFEDDLTNRLREETKVVEVGTDCGWERKGFDPKRRFVAARVFDALPMYAFNPTLVNVASSALLRQLFYKRVGEPIARPTVIVRDRMLRAVHALRRNVHCVPRYTQQQFLATYHGAKAARYAAALESLAERPVERADAHVRAFIKYEKIAEAGAVPRAISPRDPRYLAAAGRYLKAFEAPVFRALRKMFGGTVVFKGRSVFEQARLLRRYWSEFEDPVAIGLDASRFDQHVSVPFLEMVHSIWLTMAEGQDKQELSRLLSWTLHNKVTWTVEGKKVKYTLEGQRMSGDMDTSSGNCIIMCLMVWAYMESRGLKPPQYRLVNNGDDVVIVMNRTNLCLLDNVAPWFLEMGFRLKVEQPVDVFEHIVFCQTQPVWDGTVWRMLRSPVAAMAKDTVCLLAVNSFKDIKAWMTAVGEAGLSLCGGLPIVQEFYAMYVRLGGGKRNRAANLSGGLQWLSKKCTGKYTPITMQARLSFCTATGIEPSTQYHLEQVFQSIGAAFWQAADHPGFVIPGAFSDYLSL